LILFDVQLSGAESSFALTGLVGDLAKYFSPQKPINPKKYPPGVASLGRRLANFGKQATCSSCRSSD
jgi:hypothetical protein